MKKEEISLIEKEIRQLNKGLVFKKRGSVIYFVYHEFSLNLYPESETFALNIYDMNGLVTERELKLLLTMAFIAKKHGFEERDFVHKGER